MLPTKKKMEDVVQTHGVVETVYLEDVLSTIIDYRPIQSTLHTVNKDQAFVSFVALPSLYVTLFNASSTSYA